MSCFRSSGTTGRSRRTPRMKRRGARTRGEVRSLANQLIRQYSSKTEAEEILLEMQWLANYSPHTRG